MVGHLINNQMNRSHRNWFGVALLPGGLLGGGWNCVPFCWTVTPAVKMCLASTIETGGSGKGGDILEHNGAVRTEAGPKSFFWATRGTNNDNNNKKSSPLKIKTKRTEQREQIYAFCIWWRDQEYTVPATGSGEIEEQRQKARKKKPPKSDKIKPTLIDILPPTNTTIFACTACPLSERKEQSVLDRKTRSPSSVVDKVEDDIRRMEEGWCARVGLGRDRTEKGERNFTLAAC